MKHLDEFSILSQSVYVLRTRKKKQIEIVGNKSKKRHRKLPTLLRWLGC